MARYLLCLLLIASYGFIQAQEFQGIIRGQIIDEDSNPLAGGTAVIENTNNGALSDENGNFQITTDLAAGTLLVSYLGYERHQIPFTLKHAQILDLGVIKMEISIEILPCCFSYSAPPISSIPVWPVDYQRNNSKLRDSHNGYSEQAILNGQLPGIIVPQAVNPQAHFQNAYYGEAGQAMFNGLPLGPNSQMTNALLWQLERQAIRLQNPQEGLAQNGLKGVNGSYNYQSDTYIPRGLQYRNALGRGLQEHHLSAGKDYKKGALGISGHHSQGRFANIPDWQMKAASIDHYFAHKFSKLYIEFQAAEVSWEDSFGERQEEQMASLHNRFTQSIEKTKISLSQTSLWLAQSGQQAVDSSAQHDIILEVNYNFAMINLGLNAGAEYFHSDFLRNVAYFGEVNYRPFNALKITAQARQERLSTPQAQEFLASSYGGEIEFEAPDIGCAPSRAELRLASSRLHLSQNTAWLNTFELKIPLHHQTITAQLTYNRFSAAENIELGWLHWEQLGQQKSLGGSLQISGNNSFLCGEIRYWANYSYNQTQFNPYSVPMQARRASLGSTNGLAFQMPQVMPSSVLALGQEMSLQNWRFHFNLWGWLQNESAQIGNGISLQEVQLSWGHDFDSKSKLNQCRLYLHGQNLLQFSEQELFAQLPYQRPTAAFAQNPTLLLGMEISLF
ncbi:MAG: carboxypeptidase-like regulatory domain-containing protein [Bacteroidota bacterium]